MRWDFPRLGGLVALHLFIAQLALAGGPTQRAIQLRNQGIAELENEAPVRAESTFLELLKLVPDDPLPLANLAIATLRQQRFEDARGWVDKALKKAPQDARLLAIQAEIHHWSGDSRAALDAFRKAAEAAPTNLDYQYSLYRQATSTNDPAADEAAAIALSRLAKLRPENLVVLLQLGQQARERNDRAAASAVYLRVNELIWQAPRGADTLLERILDGLEAGELESLRSSALRLENVLKITPMYKEGLRELSSGIQGIPLLALRNESPRSTWGDPVEVNFRGRRLTDRANIDAALAFGDIDGDESPEIARVTGGPSPRLEILHPSTPDALQAAPAPAGLERLQLVDLNNDGRQEILGFGTDAAAVWTIGEDGRLQDVSSDYLPPGSVGRAAAVIDFDIEGDLDLLLANESILLLRNALDGVLENVAARSLPDIDLPQVHDAVASDLDRDGDLDLLLAHDGGLAWLDNLRQGRFADRTTDLATTGPANRVLSADIDNDGLTDLVVAGQGIQFFHNVEGSFAPWRLGTLQAPDEPQALAVFDADNDGFLDLAVGGPEGVTVLARRESNYTPLPLSGPLGGTRALVAADFDDDGDLDLIADGASGLTLLENVGGNSNRYLSVRLRGLNKGNSKNNVFGIGSAIEAIAGSAYQYREVNGEIVHLGLGSVATPDLLRVVWTNGVPQNRLQPETNQRIVEEQLLKGSCPFLYAGTDDGFDFVTDLLWGAPIGLPVAENLYAGADPQELVRVDGLELIGDTYQIRITEELWEAAFFDKLRLWVVDHPADVEVASSLRIVPGGSTPEIVHGSRGVRPVAEAWDAIGRNVTSRVSKRDEIYADGWQRSAYQGVSASPWAFSFELGEAPGRSIRLHLDGWIFPTDASLNLALAQRSSPAPMPPELEVETEDGWTSLMPAMGFPAGKTKTMVIDTPPLPEGASKLRVVSSQWLSWDRIAWTDSPVDSEPEVIARLEPTSADLRYRGFSSIVRQAPNAPHRFDYREMSPVSPWLPFPGRYTRYGDVRELLLEADDRSVILAPGDEMAIAFDASGLAPPAAGARRTLFLESHGWDKDADRNTGEGQQLEPLPFRAMSRYPYGPGEAFPDSPRHRQYIEEWLTRVVEPLGPGAEPTTTAP
jgi:tetratricopeptide (TPR) repeat protein